MGAWREVQVEPGSEVPAGRGGAACVAIGGRRVLCFGGADRTPTVYDDWWLLELGEQSGGGVWTKVSPVVKLSKQRKLLPRSGASLTYVPPIDGDYDSDGDDGEGGAGGDGGGGGVRPASGKVYLFGGQDPVKGVIFDDMLCLDTGSWELTDVPPQRQQQRQVLRPPGRHSHIAGAYEHQGVILFGGAGLRGPLNDVWLFHCPTASWRCLSEELAEDESPAAREMAAGTMISDAGLLVHGGRAADGSLLDDLCIFDGRAGRWVLVQQTGFPRCAHTACNAAVAAAAQAQAPQPASSSGGGGSEGGAAGPAAQQEGQGAAAAAAAEAEVGSEAASRGAGSAPAPPPASNVLLYGGFTGETVASDLLQLSFLRQQRSSGAHGLRAELRPVRAAADAAPQPRFAHAGTVLSSPGAAEVVVVGGVNQTDDLSDVHIWTV